MFSFKYAFFCIAAGLLAGWSFDKKNNIPIIGIFTYLFVVNAFSLVFDYDYSWAFLAFIEMLAGHGLYKMGFGNFLGEVFFDTKDKQSTNEQSEVKRYNNQSQHIKESVNSSNEFSPGDVANMIRILHPDSRQTPENQCKTILKEKGYELIETPPNFIIMKQDGVRLLFKSTDINEALNWARSAPKHILKKKAMKLRKSSKEDEEHLKSIRPDEFDDSY